MNEISRTSLDLQDTKRIHNAWKSRIQKHLIQSPLPWRKTNRQETNEASLLGESLETLLSQKCGQIAFRDFLKSEFCEENLDFWLACQEFKIFDSSEERTRRAARIYEEFVSPGSPRQVNVDFYTRELISRSLQQPSPSCFVVAQKKIYSLMANGSFPRFIQSEQYQVLFNAASKQRGFGKHRKASHKALSSKCHLNNIMSDKTESCASYNKLQAVSSSEHGTSPKVKLQVLIK